MSFQTQIAVFQCLREFLTNPSRFKSTSACIKFDALVMVMLYKYISVINYHNQSKSDIKHRNDDFLDYDVKCHFCGERESELIQIYKSKWHKCGFSTLGFCNACFLGSNSEHQTPFLLTSSPDKCDHCENKDTYIVGDLFTGKTKTLCLKTHFYSSTPAKIGCASDTPSTNPIEKIKAEYLTHMNAIKSPTAHYSRV
jgi:hypothetical protein